MAEETLTAGNSAELLTLAEQGPPGPAGTDGETPTVTIGSVTTLAAGSAATVSNSGTGTTAVLDFGIPAGEAGADGKDGKDGKDGTDGETPTVTIGSVTTLAAGSAATVSNSGTGTTAVLDFGIPAGEAGASASTTAQSMSYDNSASGLAAEDAQAAVDELAASIGDISTVLAGILGE